MVEDLYNEFCVDINDGFARDVANQIVSGFEVINGSPIVYTTPEYEGGPVESVDSRLDPYDILVHTTVDKLPDSADGQKECAATRAQEALAFDLLDCSYADLNTERCD